MPRALVTGASGFVGRHTLGPLLRAGYEVHAISRGAPGGDRGIIWHAADLLDGVDVVADIRPDVLVHLAWYAKPGAYWTSPENVRWVEASLALLRAFVDAGGSRVVMVGTCAEYAWDRAVYPEDAPTAPSSLYGTAKDALRRVGQALASEAGITFAWGRLFYLYGPHEPPARFVPSVARALIKGRPAPITTGRQVRDLLHVTDAGAAIAALAAADVHGTVNIASGVGTQLLEVARRVSQEVGAPELLRVGALPERENEPPSLVADVTRLTEEVGFMPRAKLDTGLAETVRWWREQLIPVSAS